MQAALHSGSTVLGACGKGVSSVSCLNTKAWTTLAICNGSAWKGDSKRTDSKQVRTITSPALCPSLLTAKGGFLPQDLCVVSGPLGTVPFKPAAEC